MDKKQVTITEEELQKLVEDISLTNFGWPFKHRASFNNRLRTTGGRYLLRSHNIEINPKQFMYFGKEALIGIIKHELCHYHLHLQGKGYQHRDQDFKWLMEKVGAPRFCDIVPGTVRTSNTIHRYQCESCSLVYRRKRKLDVRKYVCGKCKGKLKKI